MVRCLRSADFSVTFSLAKTKPVTTSTPGPTAPVATTRPPGPYDYVRLPKHVLPYHYDVELTIDLKNTNFSGRSSAFFNVTKPTDYVIIHIARMKIKQAVVRDLKSTPLKVS